jgi:hypothetical protein
VGRPRSALPRRRAAGQYTQNPALRHRQGYRNEDHSLYDFGDDWQHVIKLERWFENTDTVGIPFLL